MRLKGKPLDHYKPGLSADYEKWGRNDPALNRRIAHLDALDDEWFEVLEDRDWIATFISPSEGWAWESFLAEIGSYRPIDCPAPPVDEHTAKAFLYAKGYAILTIRNPWYPIAIMPSRGWIVEDVRPELPRDGWQADAQAFLQPPYNVGDRWPNSPEFQVGFWPYGGGDPVLLPGHQSAGGNTLACYALPNVPGVLRLRIVGWRRSQKDEKSAGPWSDPLAVTHLFPYPRRSDAWTAGVADESPSAIFKSRGAECLPALPPTIHPAIPIEAAEAYTGGAFLSLDDDWRAGPAPAATAEPQPIQVSSETKDWIASRAKRYGKSSRTGKFWRELAEKVT